MYPGICWHCHWGLSKPVADIRRRAIEELCETAVDYGPAHVVFGDENYNEECIRACIAYCDDPQYLKEGYSVNDLARIKFYLEELLTLPEDVLDPCPDEYDGLNPEDFPPIAGIEMVRC